MLVLLLLLLLLLALLLLLFYYYYHHYHYYYNYYYYLCSLLLLFYFIYLILKFVGKSTNGKIGRKHVELHLGGIFRVHILGVAVGHKRKFKGTWQSLGALLIVLVSFSNWWSQQDV